MARSKAGSVPTYRLHRRTGQAVVTLSGKDHYLGIHGSQASWAKYHELIAKWLANDRRPLDGPRPEQPSDPVPAVAQPVGNVTIVELIVMYFAHLKTIYPDYERPGSVPDSFRPSLAILRDKYGREPAAEFSPRKLNVVLQAFVQKDWVRTKCNAHLAKVRRLFRWATAEELIPAGVYHGLLAVENLRRGQTIARESKKVRPIPEEVVRATLAHAGPVVRAIAELQLITGSRPGEILAMKPSEVDRSGDIWVYKPRKHKTERHGRLRQIPIGPMAQKILGPYLDRDPNAFCFSPRESEKQRLAENHANRKTPLSCGNRPGTHRKRRPRRSPSDHYTAASYRRAIQRACESANQPKWKPNQLRHTRATEVRKLFGLDAAQSLLGHSNATMTENYAALDCAKAVEIARQVG